MALARWHWLTLRRAYCIVVRQPRGEAEVDGQDISHWPRHLSTASLPEPDRLPAWREVFGQTMIRLDIEAVEETPFHAEGTLCALPGAAFASVTASPVRIARTRQLIAGDVSDNLFVVAATAPLHIAQGGKEHLLDTGDAIFLKGAERSVIHSQLAARFINISIPISSLMAILPGCQDLAMTVISRENDLLGLLLGYAGLLCARKQPVSAEFHRLAANHVRDLVAAIAATASASQPAPERAGIRAARLRGIKAAIETRLCEADFSIHAVATQSGISPRYVRRLFQDEETTFSDFVLGKRLERAHSMLSQRVETASTIGAIAYACGFGDLSYFNRTFRRRFGMTPSELRNRQDVRL